MTSDVLEPRPETETVVETALALIGTNRTAAARILDIATGSGAILLALLSELPNARGAGTDIDQPALGVARRNAAQLGLAWEALPSEQVEERAAELARRAARDPQLARKATASLRTELGPPRLPWAAALEVERGAQLWSLRRRVSQ